MLDDRPRRGALGVPPEGEAEPGPLLLGLAVAPQPRERVGAGLRREVAVHPHRHRGVLREPELGEPCEVVLWAAVRGGGGGGEWGVGVRGVDWLYIVIFDAGCCRVVLFGVKCC